MQLNAKLDDGIINATTHMQAKTEENKNSYFHFTQFIDFHQFSIDNCVKLLCLSALPHQAVVFFF